VADTNLKNNTFSQIDTEVFWGEIAPCEHSVQIYTDDTAFLDSLAGFVAGGLKAGEAVIIIATAAHRASLEYRLRALGFHLQSAAQHDLYISLDAKETLAKFMVRGWPDDNLFKQLVKTLLTRARKNALRVRAFGEMVALLWAEGHSGATVRLEHLWTEFCHTETFALFCAYPKSGFTKDADASLQEICSAHSKIIPLHPEAAVPPAEGAKGTASL
jgi:hypothetical protein